MQIPYLAYKILDKINSAGFEAYLVGGCVRDAIMGRLMHDIDITTNALPDQIKKIFYEYTVIETGIKHGTVTVVIENENIEITTYRTESTYTDSRHPDTVNFTRDLKEDLSRRDFTMNAICADKYGNIIDIFNGKRDIENKIVRCIGSADKRLSEDALRILRAVRFASVLDFKIEKETSESLFRNKEKLSSISYERIYSELLKTLSGKNVRNILIEYFDIFSQIVPEITPMKNFDQKNPHHIYDVFTHTAVCVDSVINKPLLRLSAFLHDIGKPSTFFTDSEGIGHFYGHANKGSILTYNIMKRFKASNKDIEYVTDMVKYHDSEIVLTDKAIKRFLAKHDIDFTYDLIALKRADNRAQNIKMYNHTEYYDTLEKMVNAIIESNPCLKVSDLAINGNDLMQLGIPRGKQLGDILNSLLSAVIENKVENQKNDLLTYSEMIYSKINK